jgi:hypothetical protein
MRQAAREGEEGVQSEGDDWNLRGIFLYLSTHFLLGLKGNNGTASLGGTAGSEGP